MTRFERRGHEVHVLCGDTRLAGERPPPDAEHETRVRRSLRLYHDGAAILHPPLRERLDIERHNQRELARAIAEVRPDVISIWHLAGVSHGLLTTIAESGVPAVFAVCDDWLVYGLRLDAWAAPFDRSPLHRGIGRIVARIVGVPCTVADIGDLGPFLFVTAATEATAVAGARWTLERRDVVWSGIDRATYPDQPSAVARPWRWRLVTTGRFDPRKGFESVIRALPLLPPEATLACWGRGGEAEQSRLGQIATALGVADRVTFGTLERDELPDAYSAADVMVFPSEWAEPFGLVPVEAMACDTPVIATRVGGSAEFLHAGVNCLAFPPGDHEALALAVRRLAADEALRQRLVRGGHATVQVLDVERLADVMEAWHRYEAAGRPGPPPARRPGVPPPSAPATTLRLVGAGEAVAASGISPGGVRIDPRSLPIRTGGLRAVRFSTDGTSAAAHLPAVTDELARVVAAGGTVRVEGPNPGDLRLVRERALARWRGWRRRPPAPTGAVELTTVTRLLAAQGSVERSGTGTWEGSTLGRAMALVVRVARLTSRGPRTEVEARRR
jgi:glycosyltransferase involved in cell wall biosynthesis